MYTFLVQHMDVILLAINMAPTLLTFTVTGYLTAIFMLLNNWTTNITSLTASDKAIYSASDLEREILFLISIAKRLVCLVHKV